MGLDGGRSIGMPKSSSGLSSKLEFSDSEFVFGGGVKFKGGIDMGDGGRERDRDLGVGDRDLEGGDGDLEGRDGDLGGGSLPILPSKESSERDWRGNWYCRGARML